MRGDALVNCVRVCSVRETNDNVGILEPKAGVDIRCNFAISFEDVLDVDIDEIIEGLDVLFDQPFNLEKCREE